MLVLLRGNGGTGMLDDDADGDVDGSGGIETDELVTGEESLVVD